MKIVILGAGSWGTTLALHIAHKDKDNQVNLWEFRPDAVRLMQRDRENKEFLPSHPFPDNVQPVEHIEEAVDGAEVCLFVVPSHVVRETAQRLPNGLPAECIVLSASKGIEQDSLMRMSEVMSDVWGNRFSMERFVCLTGPSHAEEVSLGLPTSIVAAGEDINIAHFIQRLMSSDSFRIYATDDVVGAELGGSLKNVIAVAAGIADGLGFGDNIKGALLTRGSKEMSRLGVKLGGRPETFAGLSGIGDLITTCCSRHSRNRYVGEQIGRGRRLMDILEEMKMVAEGVNTTASVHAMAKREDVEMPITEQVYRILFEDVDPRQATIELMTRKLKVED